MRTIVITNQKGGCGKTTTAVNLAAALAHKGKRVLIIDLDPQAHATLGLGHNPKALNKTVFNSLSSEQVPLPNIITSTKIRRLDLVPSSSLLARADLEAGIMPRRELTLRKQLEAVSGRYDMCVIDCPPSLGPLTHNALIASTDIVVPVQVHYYALEGLKQLIATIKDTRKRFAPCPVKIQGLLLTFVEEKAALSVQVEQQMREFFGELVFDTVIHSTMSLAEAPSAGEPILTYAPESQGAAEYEALAEEITNPAYERTRKTPTEVAVAVEEPARAEQKRKEEAAITAAEADAARTAAGKAAKAKAAAEARAAKAAKAAEKAKAEAEAAKAEAKAEAEAAKAGAAAETARAAKEAEAAKAEAEAAKAEVRAAKAERAAAEAEAARAAAEAQAAKIARQAEEAARPVVVAEPPEPAGRDVSRLSVIKSRLDFLSVLAILLVVVLVTLLIVVSVTNEPPTAKSESITTNEDTPVPITLAGSDSDEDELTYNVVTPPTHGTLSGTAPDITYTPVPNYHGLDNFTFTVNDGSADSHHAMISIVVIGLNDAPTAQPKSSVTRVDRPVSVTLAASDVDRDALTFAVCEQPKRGALILSSDFSTSGELIYTPELRFTGTDSFTFKSNDGTVDSAPAVVSVDITPNHIPVADLQTVMTAENASAEVSLTGSDPDADPLIYRVVTGPAHGSLSGTEPNLVYEPEENFHGSDSFTFKVNDGSDDSLLGIVSITVTSVNDPPTADSDSVTAYEDTSASIALTGTDADGDILIYSVVEGPSHGSLSGTEPDLTYTPNEDFSGSDSFTFKANDGTVDSAVATVSITVVPVNDPPTAKRDKATTEEDTPVLIVLTGSDPDGDPLTYSLVTTPLYGSLSGTEPNLTYTPDPNFNGSDSFTFTVNDGTVESLLATVWVTVTPVDDPPTAKSHRTTRREDTPLPLSLTGDDPDGDPLTFRVVTGPSHGRLSGSEPDLTYMPNKDFTGSDNFTFVANDGTSDSTPATFSISVTGVDDPPTATNSSATIPEDTAVWIALMGSDPDGDRLTYSVLTNPSHGSLSGDPPNLTYTPNADFNGSDSFTFTVSDGRSESAPATVSIAVTSVNDPPIVGDGHATTQEDRSVQIALTSSDPDEDTLTFSIVKDPSHGKLSGEPPNLTYAPDKDYNGPDSFAFKVNDGTQDSDVATVAITVTPMSDPPVANSGSATTQEGTPAWITLTGNDPDGDPLTYSVVTGPTHGRLSGTEPNLTYTPEPYFNGSDSFTFRVSDGKFDSVVATVSIAVTPVNDAPVADARSLRTQEDTAVSIALTGSDADGDSLTFSVEEVPSNGRLSGVEPNLTYTPNENFNGPDSFTFKVSDGTVDSIPATVSITVTPVNDPPTASADSKTTTEDKPVSITLTGSDPDGYFLIYSVAQGPSHGSLSGTEPNLIYTPNKDFNGSDSFTFKASDGTADSAPATITITVTPVNDAPTATVDSKTTREDEPVSITLAGTDPDGDSLTYSVVTQPSHGILSGTEPNLTYTPNENFSGSDSFTFRASDGTSDSAPATVSVTIAPVDDPPVANSDNLTTREDTQLSITLTGSDPDGDSLTYSVATSPSYGSLSGAEPNLTYTPKKDFYGSDRFTFKVNDGKSDSAPATVSITVAPVEDPPVANSDAVTTREDTPVSIVLVASDADGDELTYIIVAPPSHGSLSGTEPNLTYTPSKDFNGSDSFTFKVNDGTTDSVPVAVSIQVTSVNDAPVATGDKIETQEDTPVSITLAGTDPDGDPLTYSVVTEPSHGTLSGTAPNLAYVPNPNFYGSDSFAFKVNDGAVDGVPAVVSITVTSVNDPPTVTGDSVTIQEDQPVAIALMGSDPDGYKLAYSVVTHPSHGTLSGTAPNLTYTPDENFNGTDGFTFKANDGTADSVHATVSITVVAVNDPPIARPESATIQEDTPMWIGLTGSDPDGDPLTYSVVTEPSHGTLGGSVPNLTYTPDKNFNGTDSFAFVVNDGTEDSSPATVSITVRPVNDTPTVKDSSETTKEDTPLPINLTGSDPDGDPLSYIVVTGPFNGKLSGTAPNLTYTPNANFNGQDLVTFKVRDGIADSALATVSITVTPVNDPPTANGDVVTTREDTPVSIGLKGSDPDGYVLSYSVVTKPSYGSLTGTEPNLTYTPNTNFSGSDSFTFKANDGTADSVPATISITVTPVDDPPIVIGSSAVTDEDTPVWIALMATDPDGDPLTYSVVTGPRHGTLSGTAPTLAYTPNPDFSGSDSFTFKVNDGKTDSVAETVSITVKSVNDPPTANSGSATTQEGRSVPIVLAGSDPEGDPLTYIIVTGPSRGSLSGTAPKLTYTPNPNFNGSDRFTFKTNDGTMDSVSATFSITVKPVDDAPMAKRDNATTREDTPITIDVLANDVDLDRVGLTVSAVSQGANGSVTINADSTLTYAPFANFHGVDTFTYTLSDAKGRTDTATVNVTIGMVNDAPTFSSVPVTAAMVDTFYTYDVNATDPDVGDVLNYTLVSKPAAMTINSTTGRIRWTPTEAQVGTNRVIVKVTDSNSIPASATQSFNIMVKAIPARVLTLAVVNGYDGKNKRSLSADGRTRIVQSSDNNRLETEFGSYISYHFSDVSLPEGATIKSVVLYVEHFEEKRFPRGQLKWSIGTGWPMNPVVWVSTDAPVHEEAQNEVVDSWDITSFADSPEKINALQLQVKNTDSGTKRKTSVDHVYAVVKWNWPIRPVEPVGPEVEYEIEDELVPIR